MMENIEKLFNQEVRHKKQIGSNIFSRSSTRKGGSKQALRTPYFYMSQKERKKLNGEVTVAFNMNQILTYNDFKIRNYKERKQLMTFWRSKYRADDIKKAMKISSNTFYKILAELDISVENKRMSSKNGIILSEEELEKHINSGEMMDFESFKSIKSIEQKDAIISAYLKKYETINNLSENWKGSYLSYLYNARSRAKSLKLSQSKESDEIQDTPSNEPETSVDKEITRLSVDSSEVETVDSIKEFPKEEDNKHTSNIDLNTNSFSFNLKGSYDAKTIKRRLELALEVLEDEEELLNIEISIRNK